ncbi:MAG: hypothetical protein J5824_02865 [Lachnospiraceae bacterium]|nr:hypothetical protein [Lachnospiraceae bacterium]
MSEQKGGGFKLNVGLPSIILLLCVLGLSMFAVLTVRAGYNGLKNARTSKAAAEEYYRAEVEVDRTRFKMMSALENGPSGGVDDSNITSLLTQIDGVSLTDNDLLAYDTRVNDYSSIHVEMALKSTGSSYRPYELEVVSHTLVVDDMEGYTGTGFEIEEIELFLD